jgi:hypothetical protein
MVWIFEIRRRETENLQAPIHGVQLRYRVAADPGGGEFLRKFAEPPGPFGR